MTEPTKRECEMAHEMAAVSGLTPEQVPGLAMVLAVMREDLLREFEALASRCQDLRDMHRDDKAYAAYADCARNIRQIVALQRSGI